jgi:NAD(P)-dependent dehydrogenase (short-subunit alcohol dehydrogenase family)
MGREGLAGTVALVTGAARRRSIGRATALRLARASRG